MISRVLATAILLMLAVAACWGDALGAGYPINPFGIMFLFFAVVAWFKSQVKNHGHEGQSTDHRPVKIPEARKLLFAVVSWNKPPVSAATGPKKVPVSGPLRPAGPTRVPPYVLPEPEIAAL
jgi:hypothetical protein